MLRAMRLVWLVLALGCAGAQHPRPLRGAVTGLAREIDSGAPIAGVVVHVRADGELAAHTVTTRADGSYALAGLRPGRYSLTAEHDGEPIDIEHISVRGGDTTAVDLMFTPGETRPVHFVFGDQRDGLIRRYHLHDASIASIEGRVADVSTRVVIAGASVSATSDHGTLLAITDDEGRYRFDHVPPGAYTVSAYYTVGGHGQLELRRSAIDVHAGDGVIVPLWIEVAR